MKEPQKTPATSPEKGLSPLIEQGMLRDLDYCFNLFWKRMGVSISHGITPRELEFAAEYYLAFSRARDLNKRQRLVELLDMHAPMPSEFMTVLADIVGGRYTRDGPKAHYSKAEQLIIYKLICVKKYRYKKKLGDIFYELSCETVGEIPDTHFKQIWQSHNRDPLVNKLFINSG